MFSLPSPSFSCHIVMCILTSPSLSPPLHMLSRDPSSSIFKTLFVLHRMVLKTKQNKKSLPFAPFLQIFWGYLLFKRSTLPGLCTTGRSLLTPPSQHLSPLMEALTAAEPKNRSCFPSQYAEHYQTLVKLSSCYFLCFY